MDIFGLRGSVGKLFKNHSAEIKKNFVNINPLSFVYPSRFVNVKSKCRKEVNYERFTIKKLICTEYFLPFPRLLSTAISPMMNWPPTLKSGLDGNVQ